MSTVPPYPSRHALTTKGSNREDIRRHNLSAVLTLLTRSGSTPRSALTEITGLNRSTISDLVTELQDLGLVTEAEAITSQGVGRPSLVVSPSEEVVAFAVNPDVDAITVAVLNLAGKIIAKVRQATPVQPAATTAVELVHQIIEQLKSQLPAHYRIAGIGVAIPGQVRHADGVIRLAPRLNWVEVPFARMLEQLTGLPVYIDNDASLGALAERDFGAGIGYREIVYLFGSAGGIGGGVIHDGMLLRGAAGYAGELGHVRISDDPHEDASGLTGTLESLVRRDLLLKALGLGNVDDEKLGEVLRADKSAKVRKIAEAQLDALSIAVGNYVNIFNPEVILLAGYLSTLFSYEPDRLMSRFRWSSLTTSQARMSVKPAILGANVLMIGAAGLAFSQLISSPASTELTRVKFKK